MFFLIINLNISVRIKFFFIPIFKGRIWAFLWKRKEENDLRVCGWNKKKIYKIVDYFIKFKYAGISLYNDNYWVGWLDKNFNKNYLNFDHKFLIILTIFNRNFKFFGFNFNGFFKLYFKKIWIYS